jgi:hypothetical protein
MTSKRDGGRTDQPANSLSCWALGWINTCLVLITPLRPKQNEIRPFYKQTWQVSETCQVSIRYRGAASLRLYK